MQYDSICVSARMSNRKPQSSKWQAIVICGKRGIAVESQRERSLFLYHCCKISTIFVKTSFSFSSCNWPILERLIWRSAVNKRLGLILLLCFKLPESKSSASREIPYQSEIDRLVIWQRIKSSPCKVAITNAGRRFAWLKLENGNGTTTTSPFTNPAKLHPPLAEASPSVKKTRSTNLFLVFLADV